MDYPGHYYVVRVMKDLGGFDIDMWLEFSRDIPRHWVRSIKERLRLCISETGV